MNRPAPGGAGRVSVDRLAVRGADLSEAEAHRLAVLVAGALGGLAAGSLHPAAGADLSVSVEVAQQPGQGLDQLARAIVAQIEAALRQEGAR